MEDLEIIDESPIDYDYWEYISGHCEYENYYKVIDQKLKTNPSFAFNYARKNGRLAPDYEKIFLSSSEFAFLYSFWVIKDKLPAKLEKVFEKNPNEALLYAIHVYKGKLPNNLEKAFKLCPKTAYEYACLINQRLSENLEKVFIKDTICERGYENFEDFHFAFEYSKNFIKGAFPHNIHKALFLRYTFDNNCNKNMLKKYFKNLYPAVKNPAASSSNKPI